MTIDELVAFTQNLTFDEVMAIGSPDLPKLMDAATHLFAHFTLHDQMIALPLMYGMLLSALERMDPSEFEQKHGVMITAEDRLRIFAAQAGVVYRESMVAHSEKDVQEGHKVN